MRHGRGPVAQNKSDFGKVFPTPIFSLYFKSGIDCFRRRAPVENDLAISFRRLKRNQLNTYGYTLIATENVGAAKTSG